jgi:branched-chain amino acid transport system substrate-binding protein
MRPIRLALCLSALAFVTGCPPKNVDATGERPRVEVKEDPTADKALADAKKLSEGKPRKVAIEALLAVRKTYSETTAGQDALYQAGVLSFEEGDYVNARKALNELLFENPLHPNANDARLKSGLAALEMKAYRDAYQTLNPLVDKLEGADKLKAQEALAKAAAGAQSISDVLKNAMKAVDSAANDGAANDGERATAMKNLEDVVETRATFISIAEVWNDLNKSHPAWPLLTFKLAKIYYHLRDWPRLDETLKLLIADAPSSPYTPDAKEMLARIARRQDVKPKVVGVVVPLSGKYKGLGDAVMRGVNLAFKGSDIEVVVKDSQGDVNLAGKMVEELAFDEGAIAVIGPLLADDSRRAALVAEELQIPIVTLTRLEGITHIGPYVFRNMVTNSQQAEALADYAMGTLGYKTFAVLYPNIPFGVELSDEFWTAVEKRGGTIRGAESYDHDATTFTPEARSLVGRLHMEDRAEYLEGLREVRAEGLDDFRKRKAIEKLKKELDPVIDFEALLLPDSWQRVSLVAPALAVEDIVTNACDKKDLEKIQKATGKSKLKTVTLLGPSTWSSPKNRQTQEFELIERGGKFVMCSVYVDGFYENSRRAATKTFVDSFHDAYREFSPTLLDAIGFDTAQILKNVIEKSAPKTRTELRDRLAAVKAHEGATGTTRFDDDREAQKPLFLLSIEPKGIKELPARKPEG